MFKDLYRDREQVPSVVGLNFAGQIQLWLLDATTAKDLFINTQRFNSKTGTKFFGSLMPRSLLTIPTEDKDYTQRRKIAAGAFFKAKMVNMTKIIRHCILEKVKEVQDKAGSGTTPLRIAEFTTELQANIIVNCSVGVKLAKEMIELEEPDGSLKSYSLPWALRKLAEEHVQRFFRPIHVLFFELLDVYISP